jgi:hypothetical protein
MAPEESESMTMMRHKILVVMLIALLGASAAGGAASAITTCPPKKCCCTPDLQEMMDHSVHLKVKMPQSCTPKAPAPCCQLEPDPQPLELAISAVSAVEHSRLTKALAAANGDLEPTRTQTRIKVSTDDGWPKIPRVPIYLQTLTFLC